MDFKMTLQFARTTAQLTTASALLETFRMINLHDAPYTEGYDDAETVAMLHEIDQ